MDIEKLWEIQQLEVKENEIAQSIKEEQKREKKISRFDKKIKNDETLKIKKKADYDNFKKELLRKNHDLKALETESKELNRKLYGGEIKNVKEIENANIKIDNMKQQISTSEEDIINRMEQEETIKAELKQFTDELAELKKKFRRYCKHYENTVKKLSEQQKKLAEQKSVVIDNTDPLLWKRYQLLKSEKKNPVATLVDGICQGCNLSVSVGNYHRAHDDTMIMRCEHCGRILYVDKMT